MVLTSWLSALSSTLFGKKISKRVRTQQSKVGAQASQPLEVLESRELLTVVAVNDVYGPSFNIMADSAFSTTGANNVVNGVTVNSGGILANDDFADINGTFSFDSTDITLVGTFHGSVTMSADGSFTYNPGSSLQSLPHGQTSLEQFTYYFGDVDGSSSATVNLTVTGVNDQTTAINLNPTGTYIEDGGAQAVGTTAIVVSDPDAGETFTVNLSFDSAAGSLAAGALTSSNGVLTITGTDTVVNAALASLLFTPAANYNAQVDISVEIMDGLEGTGSVVNGSITLTGTPVNDAPTFDLLASPDQTVNEDAVGVQTVAGFASNPTTGPANEASQDFGAYSTANDNTALFLTQPSVDLNGTLTYELNPNAFGTAIVFVSLSDTGGTANNGVDTTTKTFNIVVNAINDAPTFDLPVNPDQTVLEDTVGVQTVGSFASNISVGQGDGVGEQLSFSVTNNNNALFLVQPAIDPITGDLTYTLSPNAFGTTQVTVVLSDNGGTANGGIDSTTETFIITVTGVNDVPSFTKGADSIVNEDAAAVTIAGWATAISSGSGEADVLTFNVVSNSNPSLFAVAPTIAADGTLTYTLAEDASGTATITINLSDDGGTANGGLNTSANQTFLITALPVNDAPTFTLGADVTVSEDTAGVQSNAGFVTGITTGPTDENGQTLGTFGVSNDNTALFLVQPAIDASGNLTFTLNPNAYGDAVVTVTLSDNGGTLLSGADTTTQTFNISITAVNDAPAFTKGSDEVVNEDSGAHTVAGWATSISSGPLEADSVTFNVTNNTNPGLFQVAPAIAADGTLTYTLAANAFGAATITITLSDNGGTANGGIDTSSSQTFTITANPVNDAPSFLKGSDITVAEDAIAQTVAGWATAISAGPGETQNLTFTVATDNDALFSVLPTIDPVTGDLSYTLAPDANGVANITVTLSDDGLLANGGSDTSAPQLFTITATAVNDLPVFTVPGQSTSLEDAGPQTVTGFATGIAPGPATATDEAGQPLTFIVTNDDNTLFLAQPSIDPVTGTLTYTANPQANGSATVTVILQDNGGSSAPQTFNLTVTSVNDTPSFDLPVAPDQTVAEDAGPQTVANFATNISTGPTDESGQTPSFLVTTSDDSKFATLPSIDPITGTLSYETAANAVGTVTITVSLSDTGGTANSGIDTSATQTFTITITPVNDVPSFTVGANQTSAEDAGARTVVNFISVFSPGPADEVGQTIDYIVTNNNTALFSAQPTIAANGTLTYTAAANQSGTATVTVQIHDNAGGTDTSVTQTFTITVTPTNDLPVGNPATFTLAENSVANTTVGTVTGSDIDVGDTLTFSITGGNTNGAFAINATTGVITVANASALNFETTPTFNLVVTVTDSQSATGTANVTVNLTNVDEALELSLPSTPVTFYARHGQTPIDAGATLTDPDGPAPDYEGATLTVQITSNAHKNDRLSIYSQTPGAGRISLDGKNINFGDVRIGRITKPSTGGGAFIITFNENVTPEAVNALLKVISYKSTSTTFPTDPRTVTFAIANSAGTTLATDTQTVNVSTSKPSRPVDLHGSPITYEVGSAPVAVASAATVGGPSYLDFDGGRLDVRIAVANSQNRLGIANVGGITVVDDDVLFNGQVIGRAVVGKNSLSVNLSSSDATPAAVQALIRAVTFSTTTANTNLSAREIGFKLTDVTGVTAPGSVQTITVTPSNGS